jgi:hypothetical protein
LIGTGGRGTGIEREAAPGRERMSMSLLKWVSGGRRTGTGGSSLPVPPRARLGERGNKTRLQEKRNKRD